MGTEQGLYAELVMIRRKDLNKKKKSKRQRNITSKGIPQDQYYD